jgi:hypothetical protein
MHACIVFIIFNVPTILLTRSGGGNQVPARSIGLAESVGGFDDEQAVSRPDSPSTGLRLEHLGRI